MGRRGPPPDAAEVIQMRGTQRPDRERAHLGNDEPGYVAKAPSWLKGALPRRLWREHVAEYQRRGQRVQGFEGALAQYCALEAQIIGFRQTGAPVTASLLSQLMRFQVMFYDTPAAAVGGSSTATGGPENPFAKRGKR